MPRRNHTQARHAVSGVTRGSWRSKASAAYAMAQRASTAKEVGNVQAEQRWTRASTSLQGRMG
jgi:hypothetical protein